MLEGSYKQPLCQPHVSRFEGIHVWWNGYGHSCSSWIVPITSIPVLPSVVQKRKNFFCVVSMFLKGILKVWRNHWDKKCELAFIWGYYDVHHNLESPGCALQSKWHLIKLQHSVVGCNFGFIAMFIDKFRWQVVPITVTGKTRLGVTIRVDTFGHASYWMWIPNGYHICFQQLKQNWIVPPFFCANTICRASSVLAGTITSIANFLLNLWFSDSRHGGRLGIAMW